MKPTILILPFFLNSCNIRPFTYTDARGNTTKSLGGSVLTKATESIASITSPDGSVISFSERGKDETSGALALARTWSAVKVADFLKQSTNAKTAADASVTKAGIKSSTEKAAIAADVDKARITAETAETAIGAGVTTIPTTAAP